VSWLMSPDAEPLWEARREWMGRIKELEERLCALTAERNRLKDERDDCQRALINYADDCPGCLGYGWYEVGTQRFDCGDCREARQALAAWEGR